MKDAPVYDRTIEDLGNVVPLEHVNTRVPDQRLATIFYVSGLGLTRDPYLMTGVTNMWINVGRSQFHLPGGGPQILRGHTGLVIPNRSSLLRRLEAVKQPLEGTRFSYSERNDYVEATCPWGNRVRCFEPGDRFGNMQLGMPYVEFNVPRGTAAGIARFYKQGFDVKAKVEDNAAIVPVGRNQVLIFRESDGPTPAYDGHHIAIYIADFSGPHRFLNERKLITEESNPYQYRFTDIVDPEGGKKLFEIEHEVRSLTHPMYGRPFINRNPEQTQRGYVRGHDAFVGES